MTVADRLRTVRKERGLTQVTLAQQAGIGQGTIAQLESGRVIGSRHLPVIAAALGVSALWLATGNGPRDGDTPPVNFQPAQPDRLAELLRIYDNLPESKQAVLLAVAKALAD